MPTFYDYPIWNGKEVVGFFRCSTRLSGRTVVVMETPNLKQKYSERPKTISVPLSTRILNDDGVRYTVEIVLDVRRKSKRQVDILMRRGGSW